MTNAFLSFETIRRLSLRVSEAFLAREPTMKKRKSGEKPKKNGRFNLRKSVGPHNPKYHRFDASC